MLSAAKVFRGMTHSARSSVIWAWMSAHICSTRDEINNKSQYGETCSELHNQDLNHLASRRSAAKVFRHMTHRGHSFEPSKPCVTISGGSVSNDCTHPVTNV